MTDLVATRPEVVGDEVEESLETLQLGLSNLVGEHGLEGLRQYANSFEPESELPDSREWTDQDRVRYYRLAIIDLVELLEENQIPLGRSPEDINLGLAAMVDIFSNGFGGDLKQELTEIISAVKQDTKKPKEVGIDQRGGTPGGVSFATNEAITPREYLEAHITQESGNIESSLKLGEHQPVEKPRSPKLLLTLDENGNLTAKSRGKKPVELSQDHKLVFSMLLSQGKQAFSSESIAKLARTIDSEKSHIYWLRQFDGLITKLENISPDPVIDDFGGNAPTDLFGFTGEKLFFFDQRNGNYYRLKTNGDDVMYSYSSAHNERWYEQGACNGASTITFYDRNKREHRTANFFPERGATTTPQKKVCEGCRSREDCLEYALREGIKHGIWGGTSERERRRMRRQIAIESASQ